MEIRLLPNRYKIWGYVFIPIGLVFAYLNQFTNIRIDSPVFAFYSGFIEEKYFQLTFSNLTDELAFIFILSGLILLILSEESNETERTNQIRLKSFIYSFFLNYIVLVFNVIFIFGTGFISFVILNLFSQSVLYLICFTILTKKLH